MRALALALPAVPSRRFALARRGRGGGGGVSCGRRVRGAGREGEGGVGMDQAPRLQLREPALEPKPRRWRRRRLSVVSPTVSDWPRPWVGTGGLPGAAAGPPRGLEPIGPFAAPVAPKPRASGWTSRRRASCLSLGHPPPLSRHSPRLPLRTEQNEGLLRTRAPGPRPSSQSRS